jgi:hypothetical protein
LAVQPIAQSILYTNCGGTFLVYILGKNKSSNIGQMKAVKDIF